MHYMITDYCRQISYFRTWYPQCHHAMAVYKWHRADKVCSASILLFSNSQGPEPKIPELMLKFPS